MSDRDFSASRHRQTAIVSALRQSRIFGGLSADDMLRVADCCVLKALEKDTVLFREGEKAAGFYVIQVGAIKVFRLTPDGREQIIHVFRAPESLAETVLATKESYPANAVALDAAQVVLVRKDCFLELLEEKPRMALLMLESMSAHLKQLVTSLQNLKGRQVEGRLAVWLLQQEIAMVGGVPMVRLGLGKKVLAGQIGVTGETLSRTLGRFRDEGILRVERDCIYLLDADRLAVFAAGER